MNLNITLVIKSQLTKTLRRRLLCLIISTVEWLRHRQESPRLIHLHVLLLKLCLFKMEWSSITWTLTRIYPKRGTILKMWLAHLMPHINHTLKNSLTYQTTLKIIRNRIWRSAELIKTPLYSKISLVRFNKMMEMAQTSHFRMEKLNEERYLMVASKTYLNRLKLSGLKTFHTMRRPLFF